MKSKKLFEKGNGNSVGGLEKNFNIIPKNAKLSMNFPMAISQFENAMHRFAVKKILYKAIFMGKGLEFDSYRNFFPGDDAAMIDWKASLRADTLLARKYVEERELNIYFLVDVSNSMLFGSGSKLKAEYAAEVVAALDHLIVSSGDKAGLVMFSDKVMKVIHPSSNKNQFSFFGRALQDIKFYGGGFDLNNAIEYVLRTVSSSFTVFILVSDFIKMPKSSLRNLKLMGARYETMALMVRDPLDNELPKTGYQFVIQDPYSSRQMILDPEIAANEYGQFVRRQKIMVERYFRDARIDFMELDCTKPFVVPVSAFLRRRAQGARIL